MSGDHNMYASGSGDGQRSGWRKRTIMEMARDCGINFHQAKWPELERFAELVREDEAEKYKWDVHSCGPTCTKIGCVTVREAVQAEREACAKVCEALDPICYDTAGYTDCAAAIRARSNT